LVAALAGVILLCAEGGARAQQAEAPTRVAPAEGSAQPLSLRYRFLERYGLAEDLGRPDLVVQYRVGSIETVRSELERARGAPERREITYRTIYTERPARLGRLGEVIDTVRRYDVFRADGAAQADPRMASFLRGLRLWYHPRAGALPELISLTTNRSIRQLEYDAVLGQIFFPRLTAVLPLRPVRVADTWPISRPAARALLGKVPDAGDFQLEGSLVKVDKTGEGTSLTATIDITGELSFEEGEGAVRARLSFVFEPVPAAPAGMLRESSDPSGRGKTARDRDIIEARGYIAKVIMSLRKTLPRGEDGRLQEIQTGELQLQRRRMPVQQSDPETLSIPDPVKPPIADEMNSWVLFDDPEKRFHLRHPQDLVLLDSMQSGEVHLANRRANGSTDFLRITPVPREEDAALDRSRSDPQTFVRKLKDLWAREGYQLVDGPVGWLPDQDWEPKKRRVYLLETAIKPDREAAAVRNAARFYLDAYLVVFTRGDCFYVYATTDRDDQVAFRNQAEGVIRSLELGPSPPAMAGASGQPVPDRPLATPSSPERPAPPAVPRLDRRP
jgi:hypothetical protein